MDEIVMSLEREANAPPDTPLLAVGFCLYPVQNEQKSAEAGRPIYEDKEYVKIVVPGDRNSVVFQPATEEHKRRFPRAYEAFKNRTQIADQGTPLEHWPVINRGLCLTLKAAHIHTVEALAQVSDANLQQLGMGMRELRDQARAYIQHAKDNAGLHKLAAENQQLREQLAEQQRQIAELSQRVSQLTLQATAAAMPQTQAPTEPRQEQRARAKHAVNQ